MNEDKKSNLLILIDRNSTFETRRQVGGKGKKNITSERIRNRGIDGDRNRKEWKTR